MRRKGELRASARVRYAVRLVCFALCLAIVFWNEPALGQTDHRHHPMPLDQYITMLEDPKRDTWQKPQEVINALNIREGQVVADIGAGSGYFTMRLANAVGEKGVVFAVDVEQGMVDFLRRRLADMNIQHVRTMLVPAHDPLLINGSLDLAFVCDTYHHIEDRDIYLRKLRKALKPSGRLVIVDFYHDRDIPVGPPPSMRLSKTVVQQELAAAGFSVRQEATFLPYQYLLIAQQTTDE